MLMSGDDCRQIDKGIYSNKVLLFCPINANGIREETKLKKSIRASRIQKY